MSKPSNIKMISTLFLVSFVLFLNSPHICQSAEITQEEYVPFVGYVQKDDHLHSEAILATDFIDTECANYCSLRKEDLFR